MMNQVSFDAEPNRRQRIDRRGLHVGRRHRSADTQHRMAEIVAEPVLALLERRRRAIVSGVPPRSILNDSVRPTRR